MPGCRRPRGCDARVAAGAIAHAFLDHAAPAVGSTVQAAASEIKVWFTQEIEPAFSTIKVEDAKGKMVAKGDRAVGYSQPHADAIVLPPLAPGTYKRRVARAFDRQPRDQRRFHIQRGAMTHRAG